MISRTAAVAIGLMSLSAAAWAGTPPAGRVVLPEGDLGPGQLDLRSLADLPMDSRQARAVFDRVRQLLLERHTDRAVSETELYLAAAAGMLELMDLRARRRAGDPQGVLEANTLLHGDSLRSLDELQRGEKTGIGLEFRASSPRGGALLVQRVFAGSAAERGGLRPNDRIVALDGKDLRGAPLEETLTRLEGPAGTPITVTVDRPGWPSGPFTRVLTRSTYRVVSVDVDHPIPGSVARLRVSQIHGRTAEEVALALRAIRASGAEGIVLDLRNNQGGLVSAAAALSSSFLSPGSLIGRVEDGNGDGTDLTSTAPAAYLGPLVCLVNRFTTSAAELVASSLQLNGRASLVGEATMGKATIDTIIPLAPALRVRMTTRRYLDADGRSWEGTGIRPDHPVAPSTGGDTALATALQLLQDDRSQTGPRRRPALAIPATTRP